METIMLKTSVTKWKVIKFKDFIQLQRGFDLPEQKRVKGNHPIIASTSVVGYHETFKVKGPAVTTGRSGALGEVLYIKNDCWPLNTTLWVKDFKNNDRKFVYYKLKTLNLKKFNSGAGVPTLNKNHLEQLKIQIPDISVQTEIASILSLYDELIECNEKRIKLLEEMAQRLYTEWFVKFRFPGYEKVKMVDSGTDYGMIPVGWEIIKTGDALNVAGGGTPARSNVNFFHKGTVNWYTPTDLTKSNSMFIDYSTEKITEEAVKCSSAKKFPAYSVMMTSRATIGAIAINTTIASTNQGFITCIPTEKVKTYYLYFWLKQNKDNFINLASGATFKEIGRGRFKEIKILIPDINISNKFEAITANSGFELLNLQRKNHILCQMRDLLISQLISGKRELKNVPSFKENCVYFLR